MTEQEALNDPEMKTIIVLSGYARALGEGKDFEETTYNTAKTIMTMLPQLNIGDVNCRIINGCFDCPFNYEYDMAVGYGCKMDNEKRSIRQSKKYQPITPDWCPIKNSSVVVKYGS
jgi:hypothetical protein